MPPTPPTNNDHEDPLIHLMHNVDTTLLPEQQISVQNQVLRLSFQGCDVNLLVDASPGCGGIAWPAGQVLATYLARRSDLIKGKTVLELGSGTGLVGLVAAMLGGKVWITDQAPLLDIMRQNVILNDLTTSCTVAELNWGEPVPTDIPSPDIILAADCVYFEPAFPLLVETLSALVVDTSAEILFCYKKRRKADKRFFTLLKKKFTWTEISDDPDHAVYSREAITLLRLSKVR